MDKSQITDYLYIAAHPNAEYAEVIHTRGIRLILNLIFIKPAKVYTQPPFQMVMLRTFDSIFIPMPMK
jgi:hypothetical protein